MAADRLRDVAAQQRTQRKAIGMPSEKIATRGRGVRGEVGGD